MTATTPASFSASLNNALANLRAAIGALSADDQQRVMYALNDLEPVLKDELDALADKGTKTLPVFGSFADSLVKGAVNKALDDALAQLNAAKSTLA
jgi:hypothetical protein